ncbi:MAG: amino acid adenylation domain-containing protein [Lachnospiraceae bacterium]|nr:amino acid adenylation domain-containing protein [Lachnospiraceae bacterium]
METIWTKLLQTAKTYPDRPAVTDPWGTYTWRELVEKASGAAAILAAEDIREKPVVVMMPKKRQTLAVMMAVAARGGFYVFVDPEQPAERMKKIYDKLEAAFVVTDEEHESRLQELEYTGKCWHEEELFGDESSKEDGSAENAAEEEIVVPADLLCRPDDILYGVFTSGSTGTPKGVVVNHRSVVDFIGHFTELFGLKETDIIANQAPFDFDVSVKDIYSAVFTGAELLLIPKKYFSQPRLLLDYLCDHNITVMTWAVSALCLLSGMKGLEYRVPDKVRRVMFSGEVMPPKHLRTWQQALPEAEFVNLYGPSEITCNCTYYRINREYADTEELPIGVPFPGRRVFLVREDGTEIAGVGEPGELCVAGESIGVGYYHDPERTAEKFITAEKDGKPERSYHTGDIAYMGEDGLYYFKGRADSQIKHMGHRIELGEIEKGMMEQPEVSRACCVFDRNRNRIVAFYVGSLSTKDMRVRLREKLPGYMVPSKFFTLDAFPLNKNGKIDRQALLASL